MMETDLYKNIKHEIDSNSVTFLTDIQIGNRYGVTRQTVWRWAASNPNFPKPIKFSSGCTRWRLADVEQWETNQSWRGEA